MNIRVNTRRLCQLANIRHGRFNWLVATGLFPWVPPANGNHTRTWDSTDVLIISIYQGLVNDRANIHRAAIIANAVAAATRARPESSLVAFIEDAEDHRAVPLASWREVFDWDVTGFKHMMIFNIGERRQSIEQEIAFLRISEAA